MLDVCGWTFAVAYLVGYFISGMRADESWGTALFWPARLFRRG